MPPHTCPSRQVIELLANKWVLYVLAALRDNDHAMRFNELKRALPNVTQKMLTQTLRLLERNGLVSRTVYPTQPPSVDYRLTPLGKDASQLAAAIGQWAVAHVDEIQDARQRFDDRDPNSPTPLN